jgi:hypothetical protein
MAGSRGGSDGREDLDGGGALAGTTAALLRKLLGGGGGSVPELAELASSAGEGVDLSLGAATVGAEDAGLDDGGGLGEVLACADEVVGVAAVGGEAELVAELSALGHEGGVLGLGLDARPVSAGGSLSLSHNGGGESSDDGGETHGDGY